MTKSEQEMVRRMIREEIRALLLQISLASQDQNQWEHDTIKNTVHSELAQLIGSVASIREKEGDYAE